MENILLTQEIVTDIRMKGEPTDIRMKGEPPNVVIKMYMTKDMTGFHFCFS